jgi:hypothetical protein
MLQACKPDSVEGYHLSVPEVTYRAQAAYPPMAPQYAGSGEQPSTIGICGISACKVYPPVLLPVQAVSSYLTFSPLLPVPPEGETGRGNFLWHCLFPHHRRGTRLFTGALLCAVRTFLLSAKAETR